MSIFKNKKFIIITAASLALITAALLIVFLVIVPAVKKDRSSDNGIKLTDIRLAENGISRYSVLVPENAAEEELLAANELTSFFKESTGVSLAVTSDDSALFDDKKYVLSIGDTGVYKGSGVSVDKTALGRDGFKIVRKNRTVILKGGEARGTLFAVYEFMHLSFGFEVYALDEIYVNKSDVTYLPDFNLTSIPDIPERSPGNLNIQHNPIHALRMRAEQKMSNWAMWSHSDFRFVGSLSAENPLWRSPDSTQLCLTRDVGNLDEENTSTTNLRYAYFTALIDYIKNNDTAKYVMLGQEDRNTSCSCADCKTSNATYGGVSGTRQRFINALARDVKAWLSVNAPERKELNLVTFAYMRTFTPPVTRSSDGVYTAAHPSIIPEDNVYILIAPLYDPCFNHSIYAECNDTVRYALEGWKSLTDNIMYWTYSTDFTANLMPFNDYASWQTNYRFCKDLGIQFFYDQCTEYVTTVFYELRAYLHAKTMWDTTLDQNVLASDFIKHYYKDAAPYVQQYYDLIRSRYMTLEAQYAAKGEHLNVEPYSERNNAYLTSEAYWPIGWVLQSNALLEKAMEAVTAVEDEALREKLIARVRMESLSPRYMQLQIYGGLYNSAELVPMIDSFEADCRLSGVVNYNQQDALSIYDRIQKWRQQYL